MTAAISPYWGLLHYELYESKGPSVPGTATQRFCNFIRTLVESKIEEKTLDKEAGFYFIMDNAPSHNKEAIKEVLKGTPHEVLFLPPYTPQFNPIENIFGIWKTDAHNATMNSLDDLKSMIEAGAKRVTRDACLGSYSASVDDWYKRALIRTDF